MPVDTGALAYLSRAFTPPDPQQMEQDRYQNAILKSTAQQEPLRAQALQNQNAIQTEALQKNARMTLAQQFDAVARSSDPKATASSLFGSGFFQKAAQAAGIDPSYFKVDPNDTPEVIRQHSTDWARGLGANVPTQLETLGGPRGSLLQRDPTTGELKQVVPQEPRENQSEPTEQIVGPDGKPRIVTRSQAVGREPYIRQTSVLTAKDQNTVKQKLVNLQVLKNQLANVQQKFDALGTSDYYAPTPAGKAFDAAVDATRDSVMGITRTPGIGSMSDFESRLNQAKMPTRGMYRSVTAQQIQQLQNLVSGLDSGYTDLLPEGAQVPNVPTPTGGGPRRISSDADYNSLPSGAQYIAPDGSTRTKR